MLLGRWSGKQINDCVGDERGAVGGVAKQINDCVLAGFWVPNVNERT